MKITLADLTFIGLTIILDSVRCKTIIGGIDRAYELCREEMNITEEGEENLNGKTLICYDTCAFKRSKIIENNKFNMEKYRTLIETNTSEDKSKVIEATQDCLEQYPVMEDDCEYVQQLYECVSDTLDEDNDDADKNDEDVDDRSK